MANEDARQNWTSSAGGWVTNESLYDRVFAPVTEAVLAAADTSP